jgi:hypothetical protein
VRQHPTGTTQDLEAQTSADNLDERHKKRHEKLSEIMKALVNDKQLNTRWKRYYGILAQCRHEGKNSIFLYDFISKLRSLSGTALTTPPQSNHSRQTSSSITSPSSNNQPSAPHPLHTHPCGPHLVAPHNLMRYTNTRLYLTHLTNLNHRTHRNAPANND